MNVPSLILCTLLGSVALLGGCAPFVDSDQPEVQPGYTLTLTPGGVVGQTFVAQHGGLNGIELWIAPSPDAAGVLTLRLREDIDRADDLALSTVELAASASEGFYRFAFPAQLWSHSAYRYAFVTYEGTGSLNVGAASGEKYINGAAYLNHAPLESRQLAFRLTYDWLGMIVELAWATVRGMGLLGVAGLLYVLPGYALLKWLEPDGDRPLAAQLGVAAGIGLSVYPLLMVWTHAVGWKLGAGYAWLPPVLGLVALVVYYRFRRSPLARMTPSRSEQAAAFWSDMALVFVALLVFATRLVVVRSLAAPMWGDSYQHAVIVQLLLDHGGMFRSWEPYAPYESFTVHFGFSAAAAVFSWLTGADATQATLWVGQLINGIAVTAMYAPAYALTRSRWAAVAAVLVAGLVSVMPSYFVNWGRFAQLSGQAILPAFLATATFATEARRSLWRVAAIGSVLMAGMVLHYYRMPLYLVPLLLTIAAGLFVARRWQMLLTLAAQWAASALLGVGLLLPQLDSLLGSRLSDAAGAVMVFPSALLWQSVIEDYAIWANVRQLLGEGVLVVVGGALVVALLARRWAVAAMLVGWVVLLIAMPVARMLRLPGTNLMQSFAVLIFLYVPASLLAAHGVKLALERFGQPKLLFAAAALGALAFTPQHVRIANPNHHALVTHPDLKAMEWIRRETSPEALFVVEGFRVYAGASIVGADAGWWIPLLTQRRNTMPPQYAILNEVPRAREVERAFVELVASLESHRLSDERALQHMCRLGATHVYVGQRHGSVGAGAYQLFSSDEVRQLGEIVLARDRVLIARLPSGLCAR